jgi:hypothetical protein
MKQHIECNDVETLVKSMSKKFEEDIFAVSVNKGVASVVPDAYCLVPSLTEEQAEVVAIVGTMGQFINDIEGLFDDLHEKSLTPALISYIKHGTLDNFMEKTMVYINRQSRQASQRFVSLPQDRVELLLHIIKLRLLVATAYVNETNPDSHVLSNKFCCGIEQELGLEMTMLALLGRLERETFGNVHGNSCCGSNAHQLSSPEHFRKYVVSETEKLII